MELRTISTRELVEELKQREGVLTTIVEPYETKELEISGSATVFVVID